MKIQNREEKSEVDKLKEDTQNSKTVCIFGQGFVGLPLALSFAIRGCKTIGVDSDKVLVNNLNNGITSHVESFKGVTIQDILKKEIKWRNYMATWDGAEAVKKCSNIIVTVGIPIVDGNYIMDYLKDACCVVGENLKKQDLVVIRSTVIPGTTEEFVLPILENTSGMKAGEDFYLAYSSERISEGRAFEEFENMDTLVAGVNDKSIEKAVELLSVVCRAEVIRASCIKVVETSKVFENVQRDVNIAMVQEFARFTEALGIDIFEVIKLANTHRRVNLLTPSSGVGGYCIPNAYHYIAPKAKELKTEMRLLKMARQANQVLPEFIVDKLKELLQQQGKKINQCKIAVLGLAMKDYSNDDRMSPAVEICQILSDGNGENGGSDGDRHRVCDARCDDGDAASGGACHRVYAFDPLVSTEYSFAVNSEDEALAKADAVIILTKQQGIIYDDCEHMAKIMAIRPVCVDCKGVVNKSEAEKYGFNYWRI